MSDNVEKKQNTENVLHLVIEGKEYSWSGQYITGQQVKILAGIPLEKELFMTISVPWKDELINNEDKVDLARPGLEYFYIKKKLKFVLDRKEYEWEKQIISGTELRHLGDIADNYDLYLYIQGPWDDELIKNEYKVDLARPGIEYFYSKLVSTTVKIKLDENEIEILSGCYTVLQLKEIVNVEQDVVLERLSDGNLVELKDNISIHIVGGEQFFSHKEKPKDTFIFVNTRKKQWDKEEILYEEVVILAFGIYSTDEKVNYTVTFSKGDISNPEGTLTKGQSVKVKEGMRFDVTQTNKS